MDKKENIFGCFFEVGFDPEKSEKEFFNIAEMFRPYLWGSNGISDMLKKLKNDDYGHDLKLALFQFYVKPTLNEIEALKEIESYRKSEKSIGIPIIVTDENFFNKSEEERYDFLKRSILQKLDLLEEVVKRRKLDTNIDLLRKDLRKVLEMSDED